jgi:predicted metalloprotease with PDZ domain
LPSWTPGSYLLREYARHVVSVRAESQRRPVAIAKADKNTWLVEGASGDLTVVIRVHAFDLSVRGAYLDARRGYLNGACVFLIVCGREAEPAQVSIETPADPRCRNWRIATAMKAVAVDSRGFGRYSVEDYDELIDHPIEISDFARVEFSAAGIPHALVVAGRHHTDLKRVATDLRQLCETHLAFFGVAAPFDRYVFLGLAVDKGHGGLEHRASSSLMFSADDLPKPAALGIPGPYQRFLSLCSHEYFHAWLIKQLKPAAFSPYLLSERNYTRLLWVFEGITSYYQDLMLLRSDLIGRDAYLDRLAQTLTKVYRTPGRALQTLAESSFDAWDKLYKPEPNSRNATVSYYSKGALVALALDLTVRKATGSASSLDRVLRELWNRHGMHGEGLAEGAFEAVAEEVAGISLRPFFESAIRDTVDLPLADLLDDFGVTFELRCATGSEDRGGRVEQQRDERPLTLGVGFKSGQTGLELTRVLSGSPAEAAGLCVGDQIVALGGLRVDPGNLARRLARYASGEVVPVAYFRRDELLDAELTLAPAPLDTCSLVAEEAPAEAALGLRKAWLGG